MAETMGLWMAFEIIGFNQTLEHWVVSSEKITPHIKEWLTENVGRSQYDWDWMHYPNEPGSIYAFREENKAILFRLSGFL